MAENQCASYGKTPDWCKYKATILGTPIPVPYVPAGTQPGFMGKQTCATGYCGKPETNNGQWNACSNEKVPERIIFVMEWYDRESDLIKKYTLTYHDVDKTCEIADIINHRRFLKRHVVDTVTLSSLILGNVINIYGRQMTVEEYANSCTKQYFQRKQERAFLLIRPHAVQCMGQIYEILERQFRVLRCRMAWFTEETATAYYKDHSEDVKFYDRLVSHVTSAPVVAFVLVGENAIQRLIELTGDADPGKAKLKSPMSLRVTYGIDSIQCAVDISGTKGYVTRDSSFFLKQCRLLFPTLVPAAFLGRCSTVCIIKPHAVKKVKKGYAGPIIYDILVTGFKITAMEMFYLDGTHAEEHYEIYRSVLNEFNAMTEELSLGLCIATEISGCGEKTAKAYLENSLDLWTLFWQENFVQIH